jgi:predicted RNA binding protein YcfA (HicA-like mRNA interferase family)
MTRLGGYSGLEVIRALQNAGWTVVRRKGSHAVMEKPGCEATLSIPVHKGKDVKRGTLRDIIKDAGLSVEDFLSLL